MFVPKSIVTEALHQPLDALPVRLALRQNDPAPLAPSRARQLDGRGADSLPRTLEADVEERALPSVLGEHVVQAGAGLPA